MLRRVRIAVSIICAFACVALIALRIRSYDTNDIVSRVDSTGQLMTIGSDAGRIYVIHRTSFAAPVVSSLRQAHGWKLSTVPSRPTAATRKSFEWVSGALQEIMFPDWFVLLSLISIGVVPWLKWRYSLRTMLIATTVAAIVLGAIVWLSR
jgi:hypothetical protein